MQPTKPTLQSRRSLYDSVAIVACGVLLYAWSTSFGFTFLDDNVLILQNLAYLQDPANIFRAFTEDVFRVLHSQAAYYRPLLTLSLMVDAWISGPEPWMYHVSNALLHIGSCLLLFQFLKKFTTRAVALVFTLLFTIHPVVVASAIWIPGRNDTLLSIFVLGSLVSLLNFAESKRWHDYALHLLCLAGAFFTKETAVALPMIGAAFLYFRSHRLSARLALGWIVVVTGWALIRHHALSGNPLELGFSEIMRSLWHNSPGLLQFFGKAFLPINLSVFPILQDTTYIFGLLAVVVFVTLTWKHRAKPGFALGVLWFLLFAIPPLLRPNQTVATDLAESRMYLPMIGIFLSVASITGWEKLKPQTARRELAWVAVIVACLFLNVRHQAHYRNRFTFWENAALTSPHSPLAQRNLGAMYYLNGEFEKAEWYFQRSLALNANEPMVHNNLGLIRMNSRKLVEAENEFHKELALNPSYDDAHYNLALLYFRMNRKEAAAAQARQALAINPEHEGAVKILQALGD